MEGRGKKGGFSKGGGGREKKESVSYTLFWSRLRNFHVSRARIFINIFFSVVVCETVQAKLRSTSAIYRRILYIFLRTLFGSEKDFLISDMTYNY